MAWSNPFRRRTANTRTCWGYTFELTSQHMTEEEMEPLKFSYDKLAEDCLERLDVISPPASRSSLPRNNSTTVERKPVNAPGNEPQKHPRDLYALLKEHAPSDAKLQQLWEEVTTVPSWIDWAQIERGQDVFYRYGGAALTGLAYQSLLGGMGAARVVETLARTGGFSTKVARRRLFETTQHILQCTRSLESIQPGGEGFASSIRVRFLHAAVRKRILKLAAQRPGYYDTAKLGIPINDLDSIGTIATFSATLLYLSFPRQGLFLSEREKEDYIALWRWIGYIMGTPTTPFFSSPQCAKRTMEVLLMHEIKPTATSQILANNIIKSLEDQPPGYASGDMLIAGARWLNGNELCDCLALKRPGVYYWALMAGQCLFFMGLCYFYRTFGTLDRRKISALKKIFYKVIVESKYGLQGSVSFFEFQYIPELAMVGDEKSGGGGSGGEETKKKEGDERGSSDTVKDGNGSGSDGREHRYVEIRNLKWLLMGTGMVLLGGACMYKMFKVGVDQFVWALSHSSSSSSSLSVSSSSLAAAAAVTGSSVL